MLTNKHRARRLYLAALRRSQEGSEDYAGAARLLERSSELGSADADYALATWYLFGRYFRKDIKKGIALLKRAQRGGSSDACYDLAVSYDNGIGVPRDRVRAFHLYLEGAMRGDVPSHKQVARCFWNGCGVKRNKVLANLWGEKYEQMIQARPGQAVRRTR